MKNIVVFGLGAIGSNLLVQCVRQYPEFQYIGIDFDKVEQRNLNTQFYFKETIGKPKAISIVSSLQRFLKAFDYKFITEKIETVNEIHAICDALTGEKDDVLLIDCFDNVVSRKLIMDSGYPNILHVGFSPAYTAEIIWNEQYSLPEAGKEFDIDICQMSEAISFINFVVSFSMMVVAGFIEKGVRGNYFIKNKNVIVNL